MDPPTDYYTASLSLITFTVPKRYERLEYTSCGAYSAVARAQDRKRQGRRVAIKKLARPFQDVEHARRAYRELHLLSAIDHPNLISLLGAFSPQLQTTGELQDIYLVMPYMECDLGTLLLERGRLKCSETLKIAQGLLSGLRYLHSAGVLHRDLKPANVALSRNGGLKILDFGLARSTGVDSDGLGLTGYVCTRSYRSPEVLLSCGYGPPADLWSAGCIVAEAALGRVLFPAPNTWHLLRDMCRLVGKPPGNAAAWASAEVSKCIAELDVDSDEEGLEQQQQQQPEFGRVFAHLRLQSRGQPACDLLRKLLAFDPAARISAEAALAHPALAPQPVTPDPAVECVEVESERQVETDLAQWRDLVRVKLASLAAVSC